jgi:uncharacterized protein (DUF1800 family)
MTRVTYRINTIMQSRTDSIVIRKSLGAALILVFGLQGFDSGAIDVASLYASEPTTAPGHSLIKSDSYNGSRAEGLTVTSTVEPILKLEKEPDRSKVGKKPRRLIRKSLPDEGQSEFPQQADQGRSLNAPMAVDHATPTTKDSAAGMAKSAIGTSSGAPPISSGNSLSNLSPGVPMSSAIAGITAASPGSSMGAAGSGGTSSGGGRSVQNLMKQVPGLQQILTAPLATPGPPPEPISPPALPLGPPRSGLPPAPLNWPAYHVLNRLSYGGTPNQLNTVSHLTAQEAAVWAVRYMKEQLELDPNRPWPTNLHSTEPLPAPIVLDDSALSQRLAADRADWRTEDGLPDVLAPSLSELQDYDLIRKVYSRRQLREKMVYFWDNHFNTNYRTHNEGQYELAENEAFRANAFGKFLDLLMASAKSSAMMIYLNTDGSRKENPNENYARELQELHTLGVDVNGNPNGYTQVDIVEAAKAFTGWRTLDVARPGFRFVAGRHSPGAKQFLGQTVAFNGAGPGEGEQVLTIASRHPATAAHLAKKLCVYFVSDRPSAALLNEVASVFTDSGGDIKKVLIAILASQDFNNVANYRGLVKTPLEFVAGLHRNLGVWSPIDPFRNRLVRMGQGLYEKAPPTGYKEAADEWLNTDVLFNEVSFAYEATIPGFGSTIRYGSDTSGGSTRLWLRSLGLRTEEDVLGFLLNLTFDRQVSLTEYQTYLTTLRSAGGTFNLDNSNVETPLDRMLATMLATPRYKYQ